MRIGGLQKCSMVDYPGLPAAVVFTQGCPWRCSFCHNSALVKPECFTPPMPEEEVLAFLQSRCGRLDGVVITGGEPTLQPDLPEFLRKVKAMEYAVKLDTNGMFPERLRAAIQTGCIDYLAMDIKAPLDRYPEVVGVPTEPADLQASIGLIRASGLTYEFRTTVLPWLHTPDCMRETVEAVRGASRYALQRYEPEHAMESIRREENDAVDFTVLRDCVAPCVGEVLLRN